MKKRDITERQKEILCSPVNNCKPTVDHQHSLNKSVCIASTLLMLNYGGSFGLDWGHLSQWHICNEMKIFVRFSENKASVTN